MTLTMFLVLNRCVHLHSSFVSFWEQKECHIAEEGKKLRKCETEHIKTKEFLLNLGFLMFKSPKGKLITKRTRSFWVFFSFSMDIFQSNCTEHSCPEFKGRFVGEKRKSKCAGDKTKWQKGKGGFDL